MCIRPRTRTERRDQGQRKRAITHHEKSLTFQMCACARACLPVCLADWLFCMLESKPFKVLSIQLTHSAIKPGFGTKCLLVLIKKINLCKTSKLIYLEFWPNPRRKKFSISLPCPYCYNLQKRLNHSWFTIPQWKPYHYNFVVQCLPSRYETLN